MSIKKFFGDKNFYKLVLGIAMPIMIQNGITNLVNLLDNIMVGRLETEAMSGVTIVNQFIFIFNLVVFGALSSAGIFTAQFHGLGDKEGVRNTFRFKIIIVFAVTLICIGLFTSFDDELISLFLHESDQKGDLALTLKYGKEYLSVILIGLIPYAISQSYASTLRETGKTTLPMIASLVAVVVNFVLNYVLIFGKFGAPALGVSGAAVATTVSRFFELAIIVVYSHKDEKIAYFARGAYKSFKIPSSLVFAIMVRGLPLMVNEVLWSVGVTFTNQCYSVRGLGVVAALNISSTIANLFNVIYIALGAAISIIVGNLLGAGKIEEAKDTDTKLIAFSVLCSAIIAVLLGACSKVFPMLYNTTDEAKEIAAFMIIVYAFMLPVHAFAHAAYFTIRSGGRVFITMLLDSGFMWIFMIPTAFILANYTNISIFYLYLICQSLDIIKLIFASILLKSGTWARQLV